MINYNQLLVLCFAISIVIILSGFSSINTSTEKQSLMYNPSCSQISDNEFSVNSSDKKGCLLWGYINAKGKVNIEVETYESDTKIYAWWTMGEFLLKSDIILLDKVTTLNFPKTRKARLHVKAECGSATIKITSQHDIRD